MKLHVVAVGHKPPDWVAAGFEEYARRMPRSARIDLIEVKPAPRGRRTLSEALVSRVLAEEKSRIFAAIPSGCVKIALDERGKQLTTAELGRRLEGWMQGGRDVAFVIGSADGLAASVKQGAAAVVALSALTLPHSLCRVLLAEQLYRAASLVAGHPYHRE